MVVLLVCAGCEDRVDIIGECRVEDVSRVFELPAVASVGLLDGRVLVSLSFDVPSEDGTVRRSDWVGLWLDDALEVHGDPLWLGSGLIGATRTRWVRHDGALVAHIWSRPEPPAPWSADTVSLWTVTPPPAAAATALPVELVVPPEMFDNPAIRGYALGGVHGPGQELTLPTAVAASGVHGALVAAPPDCGARATNFYRLHLFSTSDPVATPVRWGNDTCELYDFARVPGASWMFEGANGDLSILFRAGDAQDGYLRLIVVAPDLSIRHGPRRVGAIQPSTPGSGHQARAVSLPGGRVLFLERIGGTNDCHLLRIMNADGTCAEDAPWQLPCMDEGRYESDRRVVTGYVELVAVPGGAVLVWGEHTRPPGRITETTEYREGIYAVILTPEGRRGSEVVEVTDEEATALPGVPRTETLGPYPVQPIPSATSEGDDVVVAWSDQREHAPGVYVRRLTCTVSGD